MILPAGWPALKSQAVARQNKNCHNTDMPKKRLFAIINIILLLVIVIAVAIWLTRGEEKPLLTEVSFTAVADKSVLEQTKTQTDAVIVDSGQGAYVQSIGRLENGDQDGGVWVYYIDGQKTDTVPGDYITDGGELVEWKFETY